MIGHIRAGKMTALAMVNNIRTPLLPDVPTLAETGYKGAPSQTWYGLFVPPGTPQPIIDKIAREVAAIVSEPAFRDKYLIARSQVPAINTPESSPPRSSRPRGGAGGGEGLGPAAAMRHNRPIPQKRRQERRVGKAKRAHHARSNIQSARQIGGLRCAQPTRGE